MRLKERTMKHANVDDYMFKVEKVVFGENDYEYMVTFDQFEEVVGAGLTQEEAIEDAKENLKAYFEYCLKNSIAIPSPLTKKWIDEYSGKITIRISKSLHRDMAEYAERDGMSLNHLVNDAIRFYLSEESLKAITSKAVNEILSTSDTCITAINLYKSKNRGDGWGDSYLTYGPELSFGTN